jgi:hypothetical protein
VAEPATPAHLAGLGRLFPDLTPARPLVAAAARTSESTFAAGEPGGADRAGLAGLAGGLHLAAPVYAPDDPAPVHPGHRGGPGQRAEHGHPARKPDSPVHAGPRRARHRLSATL